MDGSNHPQVAVLLVARSAVAAIPQADMAAMAERTAALPGVTRAAYGFTELGNPTLRDALFAMVAEEPDEILLLPMLVPMEPSFKNWVTRTIARWRNEHREMPWPLIRLAPPPVTVAPFNAVVAELVSAAKGEAPMASPPKEIPEATLVPAQKHRVLVCLGGPCNNAGATAVWNHFRREQDRQKLRTDGDGVMSCKTSCLGPCELAPVVQVYPEGTYYGGVDEAGLDRIIAEHILGGRVVGDLAYVANGRKQSLRRAAAADEIPSVQPQAQGSTT
jgi:(2Fe-2S) ferredoxin